MLNFGKSIYYETIQLLIFLSLMMIYLQNILVLSHCCHHIVFMFSFMQIMSVLMLPDNSVSIFSDSWIWN